MAGDIYEVCTVCVWSESGGKGAKAGEGGGGGEDDELVPSRLDIRVGKIVSVEKVRHITTTDLKRFELLTLSC